MSQFQTFKSDLTKTRIVQTDPEASRAALKDGEIMVEVEEFSFTANNVTYGASGDMIGYWQFYPALEDDNNEWGVIPVWGFGKVVASKTNGLEVGERLFGFFPPCDHAVLTPSRMGPGHFADVTPHRVDLPPSITITYASSQRPIMTQPMTMCGPFYGRSTSLLSACAMTCKKTTIMGPNR